MAYDERLQNRILSAVDGWREVASKKMFGGVCHLIQGNMFAGVYKEYLILRLGEAAAAKALSKPHIKPFDITGRPMKGWVMVGPEDVLTDDDLSTWLEKARLFALSLPAK